MASVRPTLLLPLDLIPRFHPRGRSSVDDPWLGDHAPLLSAWTGSHLTRTFRPNGQGGKLDRWFPPSLMATLVATARFPAGVFESIGAHSAATLNRLRRPCGLSSIKEPALLEELARRLARLRAGWPRG